MSDFVRIVRGTPGMIERLVVEAPAGRNLSVGDLTIAGTPVRYGGQVAECITVKLVGIANIVPQPVQNSAVGTSIRSYLDPFYPTVLGGPQGASTTLPPGSAEAFLNQGAAPLAVAKKPRAVAAKLATVAISKRHHRPINRTR